MIQPVVTPCIIQLVIACDAHAVPVTWVIKVQLHTQMQQLAVFILRSAGQGLHGFQRHLSIFKNRRSVGNPLVLIRQILRQIKHRVIDTRNNLDLAACADIGIALYRCGNGRGSL